MFQERMYVKKNSVEANIIDKIVVDILPKINPKDFDMETAVGLDSRVERITAMFSSEDPEGVIKIGLHGMGGFGKTTLAKAVFNQNYLRFNGSCFLANVSHVSGTVDGMVSLQQQLINDVLQSNNIVVNNVAHGEKLIKARIGSKRILVVIDDINHHDQYKSLVVRSFAYGSVVIVTTRQEEILDRFGVKTKYRYMVNALDPMESLTLFNQHAFGNAKPSKTLIKLSKEILCYANGLPLALEVFGSFLYMQFKVEEWEEFIEKMKGTPDRRIQDTLVISFNAIDDNVLKKIFLDVACFFIGWSKERVIRILETYCSNADRKIKNLEKRCLLTINSFDQLQMHDLLRDMGRDIARNNSPNDPERHSRLWESKHILRVLKKNKGTEAIEGIVYNNETSKELSLTTKTFERMSKLRLLHLRGFESLTGNFDMIFEDLTWLCWDQCPLECFPSEFQAPELVILELSQSYMRTLRNLNLIYSGFENYIKIHLRLEDNLPSWMIQLTDSNSRRRVCIDLTPNKSHNFLGTILCFKEATNFDSIQATYSVKNITSGFIWSDNIQNYNIGGYIIIVPRSIFSVKNGDQRIEVTADRDFSAIHVLYK